MTVTFTLCEADDKQMSKADDEAAPSKPEEDVGLPKRPELSGPQLQNALWRAVTAARPRELQTFLQEHRNHPRYNNVIDEPDEELDEDGGHVLIYSVKQGRDKGSTFGGKDFAQCITVLVEGGVDINYVDKAGKTALSWAVTLRCVNYITRLLKLGADLTKQDQDGLSPFHLCVQRGLKDIAIVMMDSNPKVTQMHDNDCSS